MPHQPHRQDTPHERTDPNADDAKSQSTHPHHQVLALQPVQPTIVTTITTFIVPQVTIVLQYYPARPTIVFEYYHIVHSSIIQVHQHQPAMMIQHSFDPVRQEQFVAQEFEESSNILRDSKCQPAVRRIRRRQKRKGKVSSVLDRECFSTNSCTPQFRMTRYRPTLVYRQREKFWKDEPSRCFIQCNRCRWIFNESEDFTSWEHRRYCVSWKWEEKFVNVERMQLVAKMSEWQAGQINLAGQRVEMKLRQIVARQNDGWEPRKSSIGSLLSCVIFDQRWVHVKLIREINRVRQVYNVVHHRYSIRLCQRNVRQFRTNCDSIVEELRRIFPKAKE